MENKIQTIRKWLGQGSINVFGMPYAGKDTQCQSLADLFGTEAMSGGHILRNSVIPEHARRLMDAGDLVPIDDYLNIVLPYLRGEQFNGKPLMLSSVGRWDGEQQGVLRATEESHHPMKAVVLLTVDEDVARRRHEQHVELGDRGPRADDDPTVFENRLHEYHTKTEPVIDFYRQKGLLIEVDGSPSPARVTEEILDELYRLASA